MRSCGSSSCCTKTNHGHGSALGIAHKVSALFISSPFINMKRRKDFPPPAPSASSGFFGPNGSGKKSHRLSAEQRDTITKGFVVPDISILWMGSSRVRVHRVTTGIACVSPGQIVPFLECAHGIECHFGSTNVPIPMHKQTPSTSAQPELRIQFSSVVLPVLKMRTEEVRVSGHHLARIISARTAA